MRNLTDLEVGSRAAAWMRVGVMWQVGSGLHCFGGIEQLAVTTVVLLEITIVGMVFVIVSKVFVVVTVTRRGVMVLVGERVVEGSVMVDFGSVVVEVSVSTEVELTTGVVVNGTVTVGVYVAVCCGPTERVKSLS